MSFYGDYHTHTKYSHGKGTIEDNVLAGYAKGLKEIGITDHGFRHGAYHVRRHHWPQMKEECSRMKVKYPFMRIYLGLETNLIHTNGSIDIEERELEDLDILICGYHKYVRTQDFREYFRFWLPNFTLDLVKRSTKKQRRINTDAYINAIIKNEIDIISHPLRGLDADMSEVAKAAAHYGTYLELNGKRVELTQADIDSCLAAGARFVINSDAHHPNRVADFTRPLEAMERLHVPKESIVNLDSVPQFRSVLAKAERARRREEAVSERGASGKGEGGDSL